MPTKKKTTIPPKSTNEATDTSISVLAALFAGLSHAVFCTCTDLNCVISEQTPADYWYPTCCSSAEEGRHRSQILVGRSPKPSSRPSPTQKLGCQGCVPGRPRRLEWFRNHRCSHSCSRGPK